MSHEPFDTLAAAWALGALDGEDRAAFERHLAEGCDVCAAELRSSAEALAAVARSVPPMIPPPEVKAALLGRINATAPTRRDAARPRRLGRLTQPSCSGPETRSATSSAPRSRISMAAGKWPAASARATA